jgi:hypothetical protein
MAFNLDDTLAIIAAHPVGHCTPHLINWLRDIGIPPQRMIVHWNKRRDMISEYNWGIKHIALKSKFNHFIFCDNDLKPNLKITQPFLDLEEDLTCVEYPCQGEHKSAWTTHTAFHTGIFKCRRRVLERIARPWFEYEAIDDGCNFRKCLCLKFAQKAMQMGFTIAHAGWSDHTPRSD